MAGSKSRPAHLVVHVLRLPFRDHDILKGSGVRHGSFVSCCLARADVAIAMIHWSNSLGKLHAGYGAISKAQSTGRALESCLGGDGSRVQWEEGRKNGAWDGGEAGGEGIADSSGRRQ